MTISIQKRVRGNPSRRKDGAAMRAARLLLVIAVVTSFLAALPAANASATAGFLAFPLWEQKDSKVKVPLNFLVRFASGHMEAETGNYAGGELCVPRDDWGITAETKWAQISLAALGVPSENVKKIHIYTDEACKGRVIRGDDEIWLNIGATPPGMGSFVGKLTHNLSSKTDTFFLFFDRTRNYDSTDQTAMILSVVDLTDPIKRVARLAMGVTDPRQLTDDQRENLRSLAYGMSSGIRLTAHPVLPHDYDSQLLALFYQGFPGPLAKPSDQPPPAAPPAAKSAVPVTPPAAPTADTIAVPPVSAAPTVVTPPVAPPAPSFVEQVQQKYAGQTGVFIFVTGNTATTPDVSFPVWGVNAQGLTSQFSQPLLIKSGEGVWDQKQLADWIAGIQVVGQDGKTVTLKRDGQTHVAVLEGGTWHACK